MIHVHVENGKYTFFTEEGDYAIHVLRYGKPWLRIEEGSKAILCMMHELYEAREKFSKLKEVLDAGP